MTLQRTTIVTLVILGLGALATVAALLQAGGLSTLFNQFALLALSPYAVFGGACFLSGRSRGLAITTLVVSALATGVAMFLYGDLIFLRPGSMSGLVFLLVPFCQLPAALLLLVVVFYLRLRSRRSSNA